jgi:hypothetical protein
MKLGGIGNGGVIGAGIVCGAMFVGAIAAIFCAGKGKAPTVGCA